MRTRLMGVETEYAFAALGRDGEALDRHAVLDRIEALAAVKGRIVRLRLEELL